MIFIGMDIAASEFCKDGKYDLDFKNPESKPEDWITSDQLAEMYQGFIKDYPVLSIEDPFDQDDWEGYAKLTANTAIQIVGDDLLVTNPNRISTAIEKKACNGLLLKVNQIGTVTESIKAQHGEGAGLGHHGLSQVRRDRGLLHRRPGCRPWNRPDQDWSSLQV